MIAKEKTLEQSGFNFKGDVFTHSDLPPGTKFALSDLDAMSDAVFLSTIRSIEKKHNFRFALVNKDVDKKSVQDKASPKPEQNKVSKQEKLPENKKAPEAQNKVHLPAIPKVLLDAGMKNVLLAPRQAFVAAGGTEQQFAREINYAVQSLMGNDFLLSCAKKNPEYLVEAIKNVGLSGLSLSPELKLGYLVPRKGKIYFNSSYMGKCEVITRGGSVSKVYAKLVFMGETFEVIEGTDPKIVHKRNPFGPQTMETLLGGYWVCKLANGETLFDVMPKERILEIRDVYSEGYDAKKGYTPWEKSGDALEMARKTIVNWGYKFMPKTGLSEHQVKVLEITGEYDREVMEDHIKSPEKKKADMFEDDGPEENATITDAKIID